MTNQLNFTLILSILKGAREILWDGVTPRVTRFATCEYVCVCVDRVNKQLTGEYVSLEGDYIKAKIKEYMGGAYTYDVYYADKHGYMLPDVAQKTLQDGRFEMIDALIAHATPVAILQAALKSHLWDGNEMPDYGIKVSRYVCHALKHATAAVLDLGTFGYNDSIDQAVYKTLQADVSARIDWQGCVETYLGEIGSKQPPQEFRAKMLEAMIADYIQKTVAA